MNEASPDPARHKAVLAAVLAVQRGFLSPDEAVRVLADLPGGEAASPMQTLLSVAPTSAKAQIEADVEALANKPETLAKTLSEMGMDAEAQSTLFALKPDTPGEAATKALSSLADRQRRVADMTARLPSATASGRYQVKREFARGGMGLIWVAMDTAVGREVALKELLPPKLGSGTTRVTDAPELVERFLREAKVTGQLEHPNIVPVYEIATREDGGVFYTMKLVRGKTMAHKLLQIANGTGTAREKLDQRLKLLDSFGDVCNAIAYAHSRGVIHRDIKPANIMLGDFGETLVLDWGLARVLGQEESSSMRRKAEEQAFSPSLLQDDTENRTLDGAVLGTPAYMPPEQARGALEMVDQRADVYALGAILYEILSGQPPYEGKTARDVLAKVLVLAPEPLAKLAPLAPPDLVSLVEKAIAREPEQRLQSAEKLASEVLAFRDGRELSVYRYSTSELVRRFVGRHKAAVAVAMIAVLLGLAGSVYAFDSVMLERDQARLNLQSADREREARVAAEQKQQGDREQLISQRKDEISAQRSRLDALRGSNLADEARTRIAELATRGVPQSGLAPADRAENARIVSGLLAAAAARGELIRLITAPVGGVSHEFVPPSVLEADQTALRERRLLAAELALINEDFALADFIVEGTITPQRASWTDKIEQARTGVLRRHREAIELALEDVRLGLARTKPERPQGNIRLEDYVIRLSAYREPQTVELLGEALAPYLQRAGEKQTPAFWAQSERDEITLICRTLGYLELPDLAVPVLVRFMEVIDDPRLSVECGTALCQTSSALAYDPLLVVRGRFGANSYPWRRIQLWWNRVPEPADLPAPTTAEEFMVRAQLRTERGDLAGALEFVTRALELDPNNVQAMVQQAGVVAPETAIELCTRALKIDPKYAHGYGVLAYAHYRNGSLNEAVEVAAKAVELEPKQSVHHLNYGFYLQQVGRNDEALVAYTESARLDPFSARAFTNRAAIYLESDRYNEAAADLSRALDLDPMRLEAWLNRGFARFQVGDLNGALEDVNRSLEVHPGYGWGLHLRGQVYEAMTRYEDALADYVLILPAYEKHFPRAYKRRARIRARFGDKPGAIADLERYLELQPEADERAEVEAEIAALK